MTLPSLQRFSKAIVGQMMAGADVNIFATHVIGQYPVGQGCQGAAGEIYRYASFDGPTAPGLLVGPTLANVAKSIQTSFPTATPITVQAEYPILPNTIGSHYIEGAFASVTANEYAGGKIVIAAKSGAGYTYDIKGNSATGNPQAGNVRFQLVQPLQVTLGTNSSVIIAPNMCNDLQSASVTTNWQVAGVTMSQTGQNSTSNNLFGWIQTKGLVGCTEDATTAIVNGQGVSLSKINNGYYAAYGATGTASGGVQGLPAIGQSVQANGSTGGIGVIYLILE